MAWSRGFKGKEATYRHAPRSPKRFSRVSSACCLALALPHFLALAPVSLCSTKALDSLLSPLVRTSGRVGKEATQEPSSSRFSGHRPSAAGKVRWRAKGEPGMQARDSTRDGGATAWRVRTGCPSPTPTNSAGHHPRLPADDQRDRRCDPLHRHLVESARD